MPVVNFREAADGGEIFRRGLQYAPQFLSGIVKATQLQERAPERDAGRCVPPVNGQALPTDFYGALELPDAAILLRELRKSNRRRIGLDPASKLFNAR